MTSFYFEYPDNTIYVAHTSGSRLSVDSLSRHIIAQHHRAVRVWEERDGKVRFIKNRFDHVDAPVDIEEFMWIKLRA
jgi:hypothetical protein